MDFLKNLLTGWKDRIEDNDVFDLLEYPGAKEHLAALVEKHLPKRVIRKMSDSRRRNQLELDVDEVSVSLDILWANEELRKPLQERVLPALIELARENPPPSMLSCADDPLPARLEETRRLLKLTDQESALMEALLVQNECLICYPLNERMRSSFGRKLQMCALFLRAKETELLKLLSEKATLRRLGCFDSDLDLNNTLAEFLDGATDEPLADNYFRRDAKETLPWEDFDELVKQHGATLKRLLTSPGKPVNILLYGAPGTGKTSFARALAHELGRTCYVIAQDTKDSRYDNRSNSSSEFRFGALQICDGQVSHADSLIIVDEADEMLRGMGGSLLSMLFGGGGPVGDKGLLNSTLDSMDTSTVWITNTPSGALDESSRRRFDYSICFEPLNCEQRKRIWQNNLARLKLKRLVSPAMVEEFSANYPVSAGGISQTLENLARMKPKKSEVRDLVAKLMKPHCELLGIQLQTKDDKFLPSKDYSLDGLNLHGEIELPRIVEAVRRFQQHSGDPDPDRPRMNLLLSGPPGTGKTEFVKYLGSVLNTKVNVRMGSDLLSMWVGGTEKSIRRAFAEAEAEHAILFLDEIDGMVQSRAMAHQNWEVTQVNELLHQMENFNGVMIGATNFTQNLDQAILRRFTFKLDFDYLDDDGKVLFFERMFHCLLSPENKERLRRIQCLAPGDFRTVRQSLFYYGGEISNSQRLDALEREAAAKRNSPFAAADRIGF